MFSLNCCMALDFILFCFQVLDLVEKVYKLAKVLTVPKVQLELSTKFNEPFVNPKIFMDYFNQVIEEFESVVPRVYIHSALEGGLGIV